MHGKTYGELFAEIDPTDEGFQRFCAGWNAAVASHGFYAEKRGDRPDIDPADYSDAQRAQLWGLYTGEIKL